MTDITFHTDLLIDGAFVRGDGEAERVLNPATGALLVELPEASVEQVHKAVSAAHRAFDGWSDSTPMERSRLLLKLADAVEARAEAFARLESLNCGKPYARALGDEIPAIADCLRYFAGAARCLGGTVAGEYLAGHTSMIRRDPVGVVASIAPWNYPLMMAAWKIAPALAGGNTVVLKPSEQTPLSTLLLAQVAAEIFPKGVLNIVCGRGGSVGQTLVEHPLVRMVSVTGDISTGKKILQAASSTVKRTGKVAGPTSCRSRHRARSAAGGLPCIASGDHGPRAISVGTATSPSMAKTWSGRSAGVVTAPERIAGNRGDPTTVECP